MELNVTRGAKDIKNEVSNAMEDGKWSGEWTEAEEGKIGKILLLSNC